MEDILSVIRVGSMIVITCLFLWAIYYNWKLKKKTQVKANNEDIEYED